ncbi:thymidylate synthase [Thermogutta sp.]|jgi:hypothetical protein|uniref:thymidylate synthase n=1 Tax=Thermogutta sp. TaxID=1962930 RepID=UPI00321FB7C5
MVHVFEYPTIDNLKQAIDDYGLDVVVRNLQTKELIDVAARWRIGQSPYRTGMARRLGILEGLMIIAGRFSLDAVKTVAPGADPTLFGPMAQYGPRLRHQWPRCVSTLRRDPASRRAVMVLPRWTETATPDCPCTVAVQFLIRRGVLTMHAYYRSWDITWGVPYDVMSLGLVGVVTAHILNVVPGTLTAYVASLHCYESTEDRAAGNTMLSVGAHLGNNPRDVRRTADLLVSMPGKIYEYCTLEEAIAYD